MARKKCPKIFLNIFSDFVIFCKSIFTVRATSVVQKKSYATILRDIEIGRSFLEKPRKTPETKFKKSPELPALLGLEQFEYHFGLAIVSVV